MHNVLSLCLLSAAAGQAATPIGATTRPAIEDASYGEALPSDPGVSLWWCDATRKVGRTRALPALRGTAVTIRAARNEFEAAQLVVQPGNALSGLRCRASDLTGPGGAVLPSHAISLLRVAYVPVTVPSDAPGKGETRGGKPEVADEWPDPLPPLTEPIDVPAGVNQPIWVLIHIPASARAGNYAGKIDLAADGWSASVRVQLHVWDFDLPKTPRMRSAFGFSPSTVFRYQAVTDAKDQRVVFEKYMQSFADHRISPYDPIAFDAMQIRFLKDAEPPRAEVNFERFDAAMQRAVDDWHITSFRLSVPGMGGGTFHSRHEGEIEGFKAGTPQYEAMFSSAVRQVESHLREKGWLDKAFVYWFDEPDPRDYDFVRAGMERLKKYAPGLCRMLTEEPTEPLFGAVDLWCPLTPSFNRDVADQRRAKGERFWWYVCTGPKAPYCTLFIDHPATDLRVWLWQTWQRRIEGILVWQSTYWTSSAAFPDSLQNPYKDPMSYVSGYSTPAGSKQYWGNGDGRFMYPPESAAGGATSPVLDGPVSSIRWEMLRDGIEDLDYLHILADCLRTRGESLNPELARRARALLEVPPEITSDITHYTFDSAPIEARRRAVARMIEELLAKTSPAEPRVREE